MYTMRPTHGFFGEIHRKLTDDPEMFQRSYRMTRQQFSSLLQLIRPRLVKESARALSPDLRLAMTIRYLATGNSQASVAQSFLVGRTSACNVIRETLEIIWDVLKPLYLPIPNCRMWKEIAEYNLKRWQIPLCLGYMDGKHVRCRNLSNSGSLLFNYKKEFSLVLLAVCDGNCRFVLVDIGQHGGISDGGTLKNSEFGKRLFAERLDLPASETLPDTTTLFDHYFVGDEAFPLHKRIQRPYGGKYLTIDKRIYNARLSRGRNCIERCFGIMASKFRILHTKIDGNEGTIEKIIQSCVVLHNFLLEQVPSRTDDENMVINPNVSNDRKKGPTNRDILKHWFNKVSVLPWMVKKIENGEM